MKTALITGGSRGIGKATVKEFLNAGYKVITTSTTGNLDYDNDSLESFQLNLSGPKSISNLARTLSKRGEEIDVHINNAATGEDRSEEIDIEILRQVLEINLIGTIDLTEQLKSLISPNNGVIINISSEFGALGDDWGYVVPAYRISKAAINMYTRNLAAQLEPKSIKVYSFDPGWVKTDMGGYDAPREVEEPAVELLQLAESGKPTGKFYKGLDERPW